MLAFLKVTLLQWPDQGMKKYFAVWEQKPRCKDFLWDLISLPQSSERMGPEAKPLVGVQGVEPLEARVFSHIHK